MNAAQLTEIAERCRHIADTHAQILKLAAYFNGLPKDDKYLGENSCIRVDVSWGDVPAEVTRMVQANATANFKPMIEKRITELGKIMVENVFKLNQTIDHYKR